MPVYIFKCSEHGETEVFRYAMDPPVSVSCPECGRKLPRFYSAERAGLPPFRSYWTEALTAGPPVQVNSKEQERKLCKRLGVERVS